LLAFASYVHEENRNLSAEKKDNDKKMLCQLKHGLTPFTGFLFSIDGNKSYGRGVIMLL
jgi:hypothetical protein